MPELKARVALDAFQKELTLAELPKKYGVHFGEISAWEPGRSIICRQRSDGVLVKWSGKFGQRAKVYPTRTNGYENDKTRELFRPV